jgi:hypothetical protein
VLIAARDLRFGEQTIDQRFLPAVAARDGRAAALLDELPTGAIAK